MVADLRIADRLRSRGPWEERIAAIAAALFASGRAARGPTFPLERPSATRWSLAGRRERLVGGGHAVSPRRRWGAARYRGPAGGRGRRHSDRTGRVSSPDAACGGGRRPP